MWTTYPPAIGISDSEVICDFPAHAEIRWSRRAEGRSLLDFFSVVERPSLFTPGMIRSDESGANRLACPGRRVERFGCGFQSCETLLEMPSPYFVCVENKAHELQHQGLGAAHRPRYEGSGARGPEVEPVYVP